MEVVAANPLRARPASPPLKRRAGALVSVSAFRRAHTNKSPATGERAELNHPEGHHTTVGCTRHGGGLAPLGRSQRLRPLAKLISCRRS